MDIMIFTDSIGDEYEIRHIVKVSKRKNGDRFYETNDGKWYSEAEFTPVKFNGVKLDSPILGEGDFIATRDKDGLYLSILKEEFLRVLKMKEQVPYDYSKYTIPTKPLPKGL